jgi:hypothetical protein
MYHARTRERIYSRVQALNPPVPAQVVFPSGADVGKNGFFKKLVLDSILAELECRCGMEHRARRPGVRAGVAAALGALVVVAAVAAALRGADDGPQWGPVSLSTTAALERLQAKLRVAQEHEHAYQGLVDTVNDAQARYARKKAAHDAERQSLSKQELLLDDVVETATEMSNAQTAGEVQQFHRAVTQLSSGMAELRSSLADADCPPTHGGQAALNMCLIKQELGQPHVALLKQGRPSAQGLAALHTALQGTEQTGRQLDRTDQRLKQDVAKAQLRLREHGAWGGEVLREQGDFAKLAAAYLPGRETRSLTQVWPTKPAAALSLLSNWMQQHDSWGLSSLAEIMKPPAPSRFDPTVDSSPPSPATPLSISLSY